MRLKKGAVSKALNTVLTVCLIVSLGLLIYITVCAVRGKPVWLGGKCIMQVITGSMEPTLHAGECVVMEKAAPETLSAGEIAAYVSEAPDIYGKIVTHRVKAVLEDGTFEMRGDANPVSDDMHVRADQIVGRYTGKAPFFTWMMSFADMRKSILLVIMLAVVAVAVYEVRTVIQIGKEVRQESREEQQERLMQEAVAREVERLKAEGLPPDAQAQNTIEKTEPEVKPEEKSEPEGKPEQEIKPESEVKPEPEEKPESEVKPEPEVTPAVKPTTEIKPDAEQKPEGDEPHPQRHPNRRKQHTGGKKNGAKRKSHRKGR